MKGIIIGNGEIGKALFQLLAPYYPTHIIDKELHDGAYDIIHIAFPYDENFDVSVAIYQERYNPRYTVIHTTVPVGTSRRLRAIHSPIEGQHPYLYESLRVFRKFIGGEQASEVADYFRRTGIKVILCDKQETTELAKLVSTTYYGVCIEYVKEVKRLCDINQVPFSEVFTLYQDSYNGGYMKLGFMDYIRPNLQPIMTKLGGHCVLPNLRLLGSKFAKFIEHLYDAGSN